MKSSQIIMLFLIISGCSSAPINPFDPNEFVINAKIIKKEKFPQPEIDQNIEKKKPNAFLRGTLQAIGEVVARISVVGAIPIVIALDELDSETQSNNPISYLVEDPDKKTYLVLSYWPNYEVGDCVKLFLSNDSVKYPPRIAQGDSC